MTTENQTRNPVTSTGENNSYLQATNLLETRNTIGGNNGWKVKKRNGTVVSFNHETVMRAISLTDLSPHRHDDLLELTLNTLRNTASTRIATPADDIGNPHTIFTVEEIQRAIELSFSQQISSCIDSGDSDSVHDLQSSLHRFITYRENRKSFHSFKSLSGELALSVLERKISRKHPGGGFETIQEVADRVAFGNTSLHPHEAKKDRGKMFEYISKRLLLMSGRHLQHGDKTQPSRNMELFTNCSTAGISAVKEYLGLNGSGIGTCYDDDLQFVDWKLAPKLVCTLSAHHKDFYNAQGLFPARDEIAKLVTDKHGESALSSIRCDEEVRYPSPIDEETIVLKGNESDTVWYLPEDSREGFANTLKIWTLYAHAATRLEACRNKVIFNKPSKDMTESDLEYIKTYGEVPPDLIAKGRVKTIVIDFSAIRPEGTPIKGMQNRTAAGAIPTIAALMKFDQTRHLIDERWEQAFVLDYLVAAFISFGGARRIAEISVKGWRDRTVLKFMQIKRSWRNHGVVGRGVNLGEGFESHYYTSNNTVGVDRDFWEYQNPSYQPKDEIDQNNMEWARTVFKLGCELQYFDLTGETAWVNVDKLNFIPHTKDEIQVLKENYPDNGKFNIKELKELWGQLVDAVSKHWYQAIINPCGEIPLYILGAFCLLADICAVYADSLEELEEAFRVATRALMRVNTMPSLYGTEVRRTQRIGVAITGVHEFAKKFFDLEFYDIINPDKNQELTKTLRRLNTVVNEEAISYAKILGVSPPHTTMTIKPSGTMSILGQVSAGAHLPDFGYRWLRKVLFSHSFDRNKIADYERSGLPVQPLVKNPGYSTVGFPTELLMMELLDGEEEGRKNRIAYETTSLSIGLENHFKYLRYLEENFINGNFPEKGNNISYTMTFPVDEDNLHFTSFEDYCNIVLQQMPHIRTCSFLPISDKFNNTAYEYMPNNRMSDEEYRRLRNALEKYRDTETFSAVSMIDDRALTCLGEHCPIE